MSNHNDIEALKGQQIEPAGPRDGLGGVGRNGTDSEHETSLHVLPTVVDATVKSGNNGYLHLADAADSRYYGQRVRLLVHVIGKAQQPYMVPAEAEIYCSNGAKGHAGRCPLQETTIVRFGADSPFLTAMLGASRTQLIGAILSAVPDRCDDARVSQPFTVMHTIEEVWVQPLAETMKAVEGGLDMDGRFVPHEWVQRRVAVITNNDQSVLDNALYVFDGVAWPDSQTQEATVIVDKIIPLDRPADNFDLTAEDIERLRIFQPSEGQSVEEKWLEIAQHAAADITHIYGRPDLHQALDLPIYSAERFYFDRDLIDGTVDVLVVGDSGQAKTSAAEKVRENVRLGAYVDAATAGRTGLKGAVEEVHRARRVKWGILPQNHRGHVILDEVGLLPKDDISELRDIRTGGIAHITKAATASTDCRVRLTLLGNPREGKRIADFVYGCEAFRDVMVDPDLRRTDLGLILRSGDVDPSLLNTVEEAFVDDLYPSELRRKLILFCWSRRPHQILFEGDAVDYLKGSAARLATKYNGAVYLVEPADLRHKLARLSVAVAGRLFSSPEGTNLLVTLSHALAAVSFLERCYDDPACALDRYAHMKRDENDMDFQLVDAAVRTLPNWQGLVDMYDRCDVYRLGDIEDGLGIDRDDRKVIIAGLRHEHLIRLDGRGARATAKFKSYLAALSRGRH